MEVNTKTLYQLLIAELRYGFTRNNHLMPGGAFSHCEAYIPQMYEVDKEMALVTVEQAAEETINEFRMLFYIDDKADNLNYNRQETYKEYKEFIMWCLKYIAEKENLRYIYNIDGFITTLEKNNEDTSWIKENFIIR